MHDLYRHLGSRSRWDVYNVPKCPVVEVTEVWAKEGGSHAGTFVETTTISAADIHDWLETVPQRCLLGGNHTRAVRIVWVGEERSGLRVSPSTQTLQTLAEAWGLQDALKYAQSSFAGVSALDPDTEGQTFTVAYHPKLLVAWRLARRGRNSAAETQAIIFVEGEERNELHRILGSDWSASTATHPMFPALLCSLVLAHGLDSTLEEIKTAVREVEARTGHHRFASRRQTQPAAGELGSLSAQMSGCAAKLATGTRKMKVIEAINDFISQHNNSNNSSAGSGKTEDQAVQTARRVESKVGSSWLLGHGFSHSYLDLLRHRVQMQAVDVAYVQQRIQIQLSALFHLIAQQDNAMAFDTASATRRIAASSLEDSSSMKMLALVAMFFLPGSFVAALFSAPLFAWDDAVARGGIGVGTRPQFALFWAVTAPLTALVFALYGVWICFQRRADRRNNSKADPLDQV
ncbi:hypothetical protein VTH82DRAFT_1562 [Thermothelomyces myriococcoides]